MEPEILKRLNFKEGDKVQINVFLFYIANPEINNAYKLQTDRKVNVLLKTVKIFSKELIKFL